MALVGADGAGKSLLARRLPDLLTVACRSVYMGTNPEAADVLLPTTRLIRAVRRRRRPSTGTAVMGSGPPPAERRSGGSGLKAWARLAHQLAEESYRSAVVRRLRRRGTVVVLDRLAWADYRAHDVQAATGAPLVRRLHGAALARAPKPDLLVVLDAPAEVLYARKAEGTLEALDRRRREYLDLAASEAGAVIVDARQSPDDVAAAVIEEIGRRLAA